MPSNVTIIGNGIVGLCVAHHLVKDGHSVTILDRAPVDEGTSTGNAGAIATAEIFPIATPGLWKRVPGMLLDPLGPLHFRLAHIPKLIPWMTQFLRACRPEDHAKGVDAMGAIMMHAQPDHDALLADIGAGHLLTGEGALFVFRSAAARDAEADQWKRREDFGIEHFILDREGIRQHEPALGDEARAGYFSPNWSHYRDPKELVQVIAESLRGRGVVFETGEVAAIERRDGNVAALRLLDGQTLVAENLVIAAGAWSGKLSQMLGEPFPIESDGGYNTTLPNPGIDMKSYVTFSEDSFVATPMSIGLRIGGAVEMGGVDAKPNYQRSEALIQLAKRYLPDLNTEGGTQWRGHRPGTPDSLPVISRSRTASNVLYAFGHGHLGLTMSATTGRLIAAMMADRDPGLVMAPYRIDRYR